MTEPGVQPPLLPPGARVVDAGVFRTLLEMEIAKAQRLRYCLAVVCVSSTLSPRVTEGWAGSLAGMVARRVRATDVVFEREPGVVALLLIDADVNALPRILDRVTDDFQAASWSAGASSYPKSAGNSDELLRQATSMLKEAEGQGGHRLRLPY